MAKITRDITDTVDLSFLANAFDNREISVYSGRSGSQTTTSNDSAINYGMTLNAGLSPFTQLQARGYYGKYDENSVVDLARIPGTIDDTANLNERLYRFDANVSHVLGRRQLLQGGIDVTSNEYRGYNRLLGDNSGHSLRD